MRQKTTKKVSSLLLALTLGSGAVMATNAYQPAPMAVAEVNAVNEGNDANEQAYQRLLAEINDIEATYNTVNSEFVALAQINGSGWAATFGGKLSGIQSGINAMKGALGNAYAAGTLTEESTLASIYEQYDTIVGDLNSLKAQFEQTINGQVNSMLYSMNMIVNSQMASLIGTLQSNLNAWGVAEQYTDRVNALLTKKADAASKVETCMAAIGATTDYVERLTTTKSTKSEIDAILVDIQNEVEAILTEAKELDTVKTAINEQAYLRLSAEITALEATYTTVYGEFTALAQINGSGWAASYGGKLSGIQGGISAMKATLGQAYAGGTLTEESTLAGIYEQYDTIVGDLNSCKALFEQTINGQVQSILYDLNMVTTSQMGNLIGNLQSNLNSWGVADQFVDRVNALLAKKSDAAGKLTAAQTSIASTTDYVERLTTAKNAKTEIYDILAEIQTEIAAIENDAKALDGVANAVAYQRLLAEINDIEATYNTVYSEFVALAQINGSGWAATFGGKLSGIQGGISAMKATLGNAYAAGTLTEESTLASIYEQYDTIVGDLNSLKAQFEQTINGQVQSILYDLNMVTSNQMGNLIGNLQNELNDLNKGEEYADRVNALWAKKSDAAGKVTEAQLAIVATTDYVERLTIAKNAKTEIYDILEEIQTECAAILADAKGTDGIAAVKYAAEFAKGKVYDLNGRVVTAPAKGLFVINGKKVVIK